MTEMFLLEDLLNLLIELEELGNKHYSKMVEMTENAELKKLFHRLSLEEAKHKEIYLSYKEKKINIVTDVITSEYKAYLDVVLQNTLSFLKGNQSIKDFQEGYTIAIQLEKETLLFLSEMKKIIVKDFHDDIENLMDQERQHLKYLLTYQ